jgi:hypothetical protein
MGVCVRRVVSIGLAALLGACAQNPQRTSLALNSADPKFTSDECKHIRNKVLDFDEEVGKRVAIGLASGLLLGPFGIPIAIAADADKNTQREVLNLELERRCVTPTAKPPGEPPPAVAG